MQERKAKEEARKKEKELEEIGNELKHAMASSRMKDKLLDEKDNSLKEKDKMLKEKDRQMMELRRRLPRAVEKEM